MRFRETTFEPLEEDRQALQDDGQIHQHFHIDATSHRSVLPNFLRNKIALGGAIAVGAAAIMGVIAEEENWLPHHETTVQPSPSLLKSVSWPEAIVLDSGNTSKTMKVEESWGGSVPLFGGIISTVDKHSISTPVTGEVQVLLDPVNNTTPGISMSWYDAGKKKLPNDKTETVYGVTDSVNYRQLKVQEVAKQCTGAYDQCIANVQNSVLSYAVELSPLNLATSALKILPLASKLPVIGDLASGLDNIIGTSPQQAAEQSQDLYVDAQQDMGQECSTGTLLMPSLLSYGIAKATDINLKGMAALDAKQPGLINASSSYAEAAKLPIHVRIVDNSGNTATQAEIDQVAPTAISKTIFARQFGSSARRVGLAGSNTCNVDNVASKEISTAMNNEVNQKDETIVAAQESASSVNN